MCVSLVIKSVGWRIDDRVKYLQSKTAELFELSWRFCNGQAIHLAKYEGDVLHLCAEEARLCALTELGSQGSGQQQNPVIQWRAGVCIQLMLLWRIVPFLCRLGEFSFCCLSNPMKLE